MIYMPMPVLQLVHRVRRYELEDCTVTQTVRIHFYSYGSVTMLSSFPSLYADVHSTMMMLMLTMMMPCFEQGP